LELIGVNMFTLSILFINYFEWVVVLFNRWLIYNVLSYFDRFEGGFSCTGRLTSHSLVTSYSGSVIDCNTIFSLFISSRLNSWWSIHDSVSSGEEAILLKCFEITVTISDQFIELNCHTMVHVIMISVGFIPIHHFDEPFVGLNTF
jgi:hypothetical protein